MIVQPVGQLLVANFDGNGRNTGNNRKGRNVFGHHSPGCYHCALTNMYLRKDDCTWPYPYPALYDNSETIVGTALKFGILMVVLLSIYLYMATDIHIFAYLNAVAGIK